jgi:hypothetical protein
VPHLRCTSSRKKCARRWARAAPLTCLSTRLYYAHFPVGPLNYWNMSFRTRVLDTLRSVFVAHPTNKLPHGVMNASETNYRKTSPGLAHCSRCIAFAMFQSFNHLFPPPNCNIFCVKRFADRRRLQTCPTTLFLRQASAITSVSATVGMHCAGRV